MSVSCGYWTGLGLPWPWCRSAPSWVAALRQLHRDVTDSGSSWTSGSPLGPCLGRTYCRSLGNSPIYCRWTAWSGRSFRHRHLSLWTASIQWRDSQWCQRMNFGSIWQFNHSNRICFPCLFCSFPCLHVKFGSLDPLVYLNRELVWSCFGADCGVCREAFLPSFSS